MKEEDDIKKLKKLQKWIFRGGVWNLLLVFYGLLGMLPSWCIYLNIFATLFSGWVYIKNKKFISKVEELDDEPKPREE